MDMQTSLQNLNWAAVLVASLSAFALGAIWYSPLLFSKRWMKESGVTEEKARNSNMFKTFGLSFLLTFIASFFLAMFIGADAGAAFGTLAGFMAGLGWVFTFMGVIYLFEQKSLAHFLINSLYSVAALTLMGFIIGIWQ